jgi:hypothetical protein|tara:strand:- start:1045 stop:1308 length:264 start_codon:yes stop_codon:yes gene_type:complete
MKKKAPVNRGNIMRHLIEYQLDMVGKRLVDTLDDDKWYFNWTMTSEQRIEFNRYAIRTMKKVFKFNTTKAKSCLEWFNEQFGLRIKN